MDQSKIHLPGYNRGRQRATSVILTLPLLLPPPFVVLTDAMLLSLIILLTTTGWPPHYSQTEVHQVLLPPCILTFLSGQPLIRTTIENISQVLFT